MYTLHFAYPFICDEHLDCFPFLAAVECCLHTHVLICLEDLTFSAFHYVQKWFGWLIQRALFIFSEPKPDSQTALLFCWWTLFFSFPICGLDNSLRGPVVQFPHLALLWTLCLQPWSRADTTLHTASQPWSPCFVSSLEEFISFLFQTQQYIKPFLK